MNDDQLKVLYAHARSNRAQRSGTCELPLEAMLAVLEHRGSEAERMETLRRVLANPACKEEFELLRAVAQAAGERPQRRLNPAWRWAAAVLVLVGAGWLWLGAPLTRESDEPRAAPADGAPGLVEPAADALVRGSIRFVWQAVPGARGYRVELLTDAGTLVTSIETADTIARYDPTPVDSAGTAFYWVVVAMLPEGAEVGSRPRRLTIRAP